ncbi:hypothetical protein NP493_1675g00006 [Ridgeia piscesae]|uniref:Aminotransferase class V domain-containing protein n=1 Tax=Ridgeia piscesae TaxID=27915 RepID=A0AAD9N951_RIDPI|nr:hypothetical protein NP493_1675g00006 [Ridgeia piscesae]
MATFGRDTEKLLFRHEEGATFLNHGSWGSVPRPVYDERLRLLDEQESAPDRWFRWRVADLWTDNLEAACRFVGAQFQNTAFVRNATTAVNTVLKSLPLKSGDAILVYSWTHHAVRNICDATAQRTGADVLSVDIKIPIKSRHDIVAQYREMLDTHPNVKIAVLGKIMGSSHA